MLLIPSIWTTLIKVLSLALTFPAKTIQILLPSENIKDSIPNKVTRNSNGWLRTSKGNRRGIYSQFISNLIPLNTRMTRDPVKSDAITLTKLTKQRVTFSNIVRGIVIPA